MAATIVASLPTGHQRYIEPFAGSAAVLSAKDRSPIEILADSNAQLVHFYQTLRTSAAAIHRLAARMDPDNYYGIRASRPVNAIARAARFWFLNRHCFNGVYRTNRRDEFNVPKGRRTGALPSLSHLEAFAARLDSVDIRCADYRETLAEAEEGDVVYLDPPYAVTRSTYGEYGYASSAFSLADLLDAAVDLDRRGVKVLISFNERSAFDAMPPHWEIAAATTFHAVAAEVGRRRHAPEYLVGNYGFASRLAIECA